MRFGRLPEVSPLFFAGCSGGGDEFSPPRIRQTLPDMEGTCSAAFANSGKRWFRPPGGSHGTGRSPETEKQI